MRMSIHNEKIIADYQFIESYFSFELNEKQLRQFEDRFENDPVFRERVVQFEKIDSTVRQLTSKQTQKGEEIKNEWKAQLRESERKLKKPSLIIRLNPFLKIAAVFLLLFIGGYLLGRLNPGPSTMSAVSEAYWQSSPKSAFPHLVLKSTDTSLTKEPILTEAYNAFKAQQYSKTIDLLQEVPRDSSYHMVLLLQGESYLGLNQAEQSIDLFQEIIDKPNGPGKDEALWFQALAYLLITQSDPAIFNLNLIIKNNYPQAKKAKELLKDLDKVIDS